MTGINKEKISEQEARKHRSLKILTSKDIPFIDHLPPIESEAESLRRDTDKIANRAISLCIVSAKGEGMPQEHVMQLVKEFEIFDYLSEKEKIFIKDPSPTDSEKIQFTWRYESYWVLLWSLGFVKKLSFPNKICNVVKAINYLRLRGKQKFLTDSQLRQQKELLDEADLIYRYHWAIVDARIRGEMNPVNLNSSVVMERHYALNWLIGANENANWDNVSIDT